MATKRILAALLMAASAMASISVNASPASAELGELQETWWGLETKGTSRVLDGWMQDPLGWALEPSGGAMFVGGQFLDVTNGQETIRQPYLAAFDAGDGRPVRWFTPDLGGPVLTLESSPDGGIIVGGEMDTYNGAIVDALTKIDPLTGEIWPGWQTRVWGGTSVVREVSLEADGWMYVVGSFETATDGNSTIAVDGAIRINPDTGAIDTSWHPVVEGGSVWGVAASQTNDRVYLAGWFDSVNGDDTARGFAGVSTIDGSLLDNRATIPYNSCVDGFEGCPQNYFLYDIEATEHGDVWVVGEQHALFILEESNGLALRKMHYTGCNRVFQVECTRAGGEYQEIERVGDRIYASCHCWGRHQSDTEMILHSRKEEGFPGGTPTGAISSIAGYEVLSGDRIEAFSPYMSGTAGGFAIAGASDGCLWLAGGYDQVGQIGNQRRARDLVRLCDANGPGPDPQPNPVDPNGPGDVAAPLSCAADNEGTAATITWEASTGADDYRIFRSIDGGNSYWRGKTTEPTFADTLRSSGQHSYTVAARGATGVWSEVTPCSPVLDPQAGVEPAPPPASCSAANDGTAATVSWDQSPGATSYRVFRSIDGNSTYWRGVTSELTFADTLRSAGQHTYSVQARGPDGIWSTSALCGPELDPATGLTAVQAPANCVVISDGLDATVSWTGSENSVDYRIFRSVSGGTTYWRGLTTNESFSDLLRSGATHAYEVQARGENGIWSQTADCV